MVQIAGPSWALDLARLFTDLFTPELDIPVTTAEATGSIPVAPTQGTYAEFVLAEAGGPSSAVPRAAYREPLSSPHGLIAGPAPAPLPPGPPAPPGRTRGSCRRPGPRAPF